MFLHYLHQGGFYITVVPCPMTCIEEENDEEDGMGYRALQTGGANCGATSQGAH